MEHGQHLADENLQKLRTISNPSETDSSCSTVMYSSHNLSLKVDLDVRTKNENIENCIIDSSLRKPLNTSSVSPSNDTIRYSDNLNCDRGGNLSHEKYCSSSSNRYNTHTIFLLIHLLIFFIPRF